ncbi:MAG: ribosome biogenesis GTPase Der [Chloroflexota bacterium]
MPVKSLVALVGRPNVGKSTLFNRLVGERRAIVEDTPGTTRDRHYADAEWGGQVFTLIDTGGLILGDADEISTHVRAQAQLAMAEADVIVFLVDIVEGLSGPDHAIADLLRRANKPVILAVNKSDNLKREMNIHEFYALGLGEPLAISAVRGLSTGDLLDRIVAALPRLVPEDQAEDPAIHMAIVGRTNVGKSSLLNRLLGYERVIVSATPGTTRDAIDSRIRYHEQEFVLIDTAGIRRRGSIEPGVEKYSVLRTLKAISRADLVLLLIDAVEGVTAQDAHVAGYVLDEAKSVIVLVNKWDLIEKDSYTQIQYEEHVRRELRFMSYVPVLFISALTGRNVSNVMATALRIHKARTARLSTADLNNVFRQATARRPPPSRGGSKLRIYYATQTGVAPPTFVLFVNDSKLVHFGYERYLENQIRELYKFEGTPIRLIFRDHEDQDERR